MIKNFIYKGMAAAGKKPGDDDEGKISYFKILYYCHIQYSK